MRGDGLPKETSYAAYLIICVLVYYVLWSRVIKIYYRTKGPQLSSLSFYVITSLSSVTILGVRFSRFVFGSLLVRIYNQK